MATNPAQSRYIADSVSTATPAQLVVMLYDRMGLDLRRANDALSGGDGTQDGQVRGAASPHLLHAQQILAELLATLRVDAWDGAAELAALYSFLIRELVAINADGEVARLNKCQELLNGLHSAWRSAAGQLTTTESLRRESTNSPGAWVA